MQYEGFNSTQFQSLRYKKRSAGNSAIHVTPLLVAVSKNMKKTLVAKDFI